MRRTPSSVSSSESPIPTRTAALARNRPAVGTARVSPSRPSNPASARKSARPPPSAASTAAAPDPRSPPLVTPTASRPADTRSAAGVVVVNVIDTGPPELFGTMIVAGGSGFGTDRAELPFLPPRERVDEVGEPVEVGHHLALAEPTAVHRRDRLTLRPS